MSRHEQSNHGLEFEVPKSADSTQYHEPTSNRPFSIDLSLELERQLDMEPMSPNPAHQSFAHSPRTSQQKRESLDPLILASIIMQLRQSLEEVSKERDDLLNLVSSAHSQEAELKDALELMTEKATGMEDELSEARRKMKDDEDAIAMLRTKVEESRRGLMRLQTENRRQSTAPMTIDMSRAGIPSFGTGPASSKRASFTPMTGSFAPRPQGHRRISSVSDSGISSGLPAPDLTTSPSPHTQGFAFSDNTSTQIPANPTLNPPPAGSRRFSGMFGRGSPPRLELPSQQDPTITDVDALRRELRAIQDELEETRNELSESNEAREASETCVKALREFIGENNVGAGGTAVASEPAAVKLPLPPTMTTGEETDARKTGVMGGAAWGFKLWKVDTSVKSGSGPTSGTSTTTSPILAPTPQIPTSLGAPLSRKLGGFFSSRASVSSATSNASTSNNSNPTSLPQLQTNAATNKASRDSMYSSSDTSSVAEPISPTNEVNGDVVVRDVVVRDVTVLSDLGSSGGSPDGVKGGMALEREKGTVVLG